MGQQLEDGETLDFDKVVLNGVLLKGTLDWKTEWKMEQKMEKSYQAHINLMIYFFFS